MAVTATNGGLFLTLFVNSQSEQYDTRAGISHLPLLLLQNTEGTSYSVFNEGSVCSAEPCSLPVSSNRTNYTTKTCSRSNCVCVSLLWSSVQSQQINIRDLSLLSLRCLFIHLLCVSQVSVLAVGYLCLCQSPYRFLFLSFQECKRYTACF